MSILRTQLPVGKIVSLLTQDGTYIQVQTEADPSAGAVDSVFGRVGNVLAQVGDYLASQITNDSTVTGPTVTAALETLKAAIAAIPPAPVSSVFARTGAIVSAFADYTTTKIQDTSFWTFGPTADLSDILNWLYVAMLTFATPNSNNGNSGAAITIDFLGSRIQQVTLNDATPVLTLKFPTFPTVQPIGFQWGAFYLLIVQDGVGGRVPSFAFTDGGVAKAPGGVLTIAPGANAQTWIQIVNADTGGTKVLNSLPALANV